MGLVRDWKELQGLLTVVPRGSTDYVSNMYAGPGQVDRWGAAGHLHAVTGDGAVLLLRSDGDFRRIYHNARDARALTRALCLLPAAVYVTDLVGQERALHDVVAAYAAAGFELRTFLRRMVRVHVLDPRMQDRVDAASADDTVELDGFLRGLLDRYVEQLPDIAELRTAADDGRMLVVRDRGRIRGMLMYDMTAHVAHLRFWHVDRDAQGSGIGSQLMAGFLSRCSGVKRIVLWVIGDNDRSIAIYRHYGFEADGLLDRVMMLHKDQ